MNLLELEEGERAVIVKVIDKEIAFQLMAKGVRVGMELQLSRKVVFGASLYLKFATHNMAIRNREAAFIEIRKI